MKKLLLLLSIAFSINTNAQTTVPGGTVSGTWTLAGSPYNIQGSIQVVDATTLTIDPGVTVNFQGTYKLLVTGRLLAIGTQTDTITFTADNTTNGWRSIRFENTPATNDTSWISYCKVIYSKATGSDLYGGGIYINNFSKVIVEHSRISNCIANPSNGSGGAIGIYTCNPIIRHNKINNNTGNSKGGGIFIYYSSPKIQQNTISNNTADEGGGISSEHGSPEISDNSIISNSISGNSKKGAGIKISGSSNSCQILNNTITSNTNSGGDGGGIYLDASVYIAGNTISNNSASNGAGILIQNSIQIIENNIIEYNIASSQGGGIKFSNSNVQIVRNNIVRNNEAGNEGGGFYINSGSANLQSTGNQILYNTSGNRGGGVFSYRDNQYFQFCIIANNSSGEGGGFYCNQSFTLDNCIIANNNATTNGGGIQSSQGLLQNILNSTIVNNSAVNGAGIHCVYSSSPFIKNTVLWGNTASISGNQLYLDLDGSDPNFYYCNVQGGMAAFGLNGNFYTGTYSNTINSDPLFIAPSVGVGTAFNGLTADWSLQSNSPCINTGTPDTTGLNLPATDIAGNTRVTVCRIDMGAYENQNGTPLSSSIAQTQQILCYGDASAAITFTPSGGAPSPTYTYSWTPNVSTTNIASGLIAGSYSVTATETAFGCSVTNSITIGQPSQLTFTTTQINVSCFGGSDGSITVTASGGTGTKQYSKDNGVNYQSSNIFSGLAQGTYTIVVKDANNCLTASQDVTITEPEVLSFTYSQSNVLCNGGNSGTITVTASGGTGTKYYSRDGGTNFQSSNILSGLTSGTYSVVVKDANNCVTAAQDVTITEPTAITSSISSQENVHCNGGSNGSVTITASGGTGSLDYLWSPGGSTTNSLNNLSAGTYVCTISDDNNCTHTQNVIISEPVAIDNVPVCLVTVDSSSTHNIIYWEKPATVMIDTFFIYREVTSNNYVKIASVPYDSLNEYPDYAADPNVTSYKYKVSVLDTCGFESAESDYHNTIHLQNLGSGSLQWTLYDIENSGNPVTYYRVYRDDVGNGNFQPISSTIPGSNSTYTDVNYSSFPNAVYVVDVNWNISCTPYRSSVTTTRSNTWSPLTVGMKSELEKQIAVYPNPASQTVTIEIPNSLNVLNLKIYNVLGEVVYDDASFDKAKKQINVEGFAKGVYTLKLESNSGMINRKIILQ